MLHQKNVKRTYQKKLNENKNVEIMKRRDLVKRAIIATAGLIVGAPLVSAVTNKTPKIWTELESDKEPSYWLGMDPATGNSSSWTHVMIKGSDNNIYIDGQWSRQLTSEEIRSLYNNGKSLTIDELMYKDKDLKPVWLYLSSYPNQSISMWVNGKEFLPFNIK